MIDKIDIIPLDERPGSFIGEAFKIIKSKDYYIVFDKYHAKRIVVFDNKGEFVKNVVDIGKGPEEALQLNDYWLNKEGNLEVYDFLQKQVFVFGKDLNFVKSIKGQEPLVFSSLIRIPNSSKLVGYKGYTAFNKAYKGNYYKLAILDSLLRIKDTDLHYDGLMNDVMVTTPVTPFTKFNDTIRLSQNFDPFIYNVTPDGIFKRYELLYTHKPFPLDFENQIIQKELALFKCGEVDFSKINKLYQGYTGYNGIWVETTSYIIFESFDTDYNPFFSIYDKKEKQIVAQGKTLKESSRFKMSLPSFVTTETNDNQFISIWPGFMLKSFISADSPFGDLINKDLEANYIVNVKLK